MTEETDRPSPVKERHSAEIMSELAQVWRTNHEINRRLIEAISDEGLRCSLSQRGGRSVARQFGHLHYVRIYHLQARAKALAEGAHLFESKEEPERSALLDALTDSTGRILLWLEQVNQGVKGVRSFKRGLFQHLAYFIAHESHHRGNILLTLKQCGHALPTEVRYGIWDWDKI